MVTMDIDRPDSPDLTTLCDGPPTVEYIRKTYGSVTNFMEQYAYCGDSMGKNIRMLIGIPRDTHLPPQCCKCMMGHADASAFVYLCNFKDAAIIVLCHTCLVEIRSVMAKLKYVLCPICQQWGHGYAMQGLCGARIRPSDATANEMYVCVVPIQPDLYVVHRRSARNSVIAR